MCKLRSNTHKTELILFPGAVPPFRTPFKSITPLCSGLGLGRPLYRPCASFKTSLHPAPTCTYLHTVTNKATGAFWNTSPHLARDSALTQSKSALYKLLIPAILTPSLSGVLHAPATASHSKLSSQNVSVTSVTIQGTRRSPTSQLHSKY
jgi:hypothetical protein